MVVVDDINGCLPRSLYNRTTSDPAKGKDFEKRIFGKSEWDSYAIGFPSTLKI